MYDKNTDNSNLKKILQIQNICFKEELFVIYTQYIKKEDKRDLIIFNTNNHF